MIMNSLKKLVTGDGRPVTVAELAQLYRNVVNQSVPVSGKVQRLGKDAYSITNNFKTVDCDNLESIKTFKIYSLNTKTNSTSECCIDSVRCISDAHRVSEVASATSENGRFLARLKHSSCPGKSSDISRQLLEIWDRAKLVKTINVSDLEAHGPINTDEQFSSFHWSKFGEQDKLLYICQRKRPKHLSFFAEYKESSSTHDKHDKNASSEESQKTVGRGEEYLRKEDWGECLNSIEHTLVAVLDISNDCHITTIDIEGFSLSEAQWCSNGDKIVSVAYHEQPRRVGIIYCNNRSSSILVHEWRSNTNTPVLEITNDRECYHSIRVNHKGDKFLYLANPVFGAHHHSVKIYLQDLIDNTTKNLIDKSTDRSEFFIESLPSNCFTTDDKNILMITKDQLHDHMCLYSIDRELLIKIRFPTTGVTILDFRYDIILASGSEINATPTLYVALLNTSNINDAVAWHQIEDCLHLHEVNYETYVIPTEDDKSTISAILVQPDLKVLQENIEPKNSLITNVNDLPTVIYVHGGPHSAFSVHYTAVTILRARLGLRSLLINYRGSTGVSEEYVQELTGKVGDIDVGDCLHMIRYFVNKEIINPKKLIISGGSHGGFLTCHLSCQDEFKFTSALIRNPVVDISSLHATSDIPDWSYNVSLGHQHHDFTWYPNGLDLVKMYECSPVSKISKANVPTLMLLGSKDRRVNMYQGERWFELLKARGIETQCKVYCDEHALAKAEVAADVEISSQIWILDHL